MRKGILILLLAIVFETAICFAYRVGIRHAISESVYYIVDYDEVMFNGKDYDTTLYIELDGNVYAQGLYIG